MLIPALKVEWAKLQPWIEDMEKMRFMSEY